MIEFTKECPTCGGTGAQYAGSSAAHSPECDGGSGCDRTCPIEVPHWEPCPDCVGGWLPDDDTVEAAAKAVAAERLGTHREPRWGDIDYYAPTTRAALVAAARHQKENE